MSVLRPLGWFGIARLGLVQAALGAMVVLATSTLNRVMVVELALPAIVPGLLVALHYAAQIMRPRMGYGSDVGRRRTPWIVGGMAALALGGVAAAASVALMRTQPLAGLAGAVAAFALIGLGVGASGTSLLVLLASRVAPARRAAAASTVWIMMIAGIAVTATVAGKLLDPFSASRLIAVTAAVAAIAFVATLLAVWRMEGDAAGPAAPAAAAPPFMAALAQVWAEKRARDFAIFVFLSMLAYSAQELVIEPFAGAVFHLTPGQSTHLTGVLHQGVLLGMLLVAVGGSWLRGSGPGRGSMRGWTVGGCVGSAVGVLALGLGSLIGPSWPLLPGVFVLGVANGTFAVAAIGAMMALAGDGRASREGTRMGVWGAAQALAFGAGGVLGTSASDLARLALGSPEAGYACVFAAEALLFVFAAIQARRVFQPAATATQFLPRAAEVTP